MPTDSQGPQGEADVSFADILKQFESAQPAPKPRPAAPQRSRGRATFSGPPPRRGRIVGVSGDFVLVDYGAKAEGVMPIADVRDRSGQLQVQPGEEIDVTTTGFNSEGMMVLSRVAGPRPRDWEALRLAFDEKSVIAGRVTGQIRGGFSVDVGVRAFLPASRCGVRDAAEAAALVGQEIRCRVIKFDADSEDVVLDRRAVLDEEAAQAREAAMQSLEEGTVVRGTVRSIASFGAFVNVGGADGLLHVGDMSWSRVADPSTVVSEGDSIDVKILKIDRNSGRISLGLKQLLPDPWDEAIARFTPGDRVQGEVTRMTEFGAFIEVLPGVEGLIHVSEMSWTRRVRRPEDVLKTGERVEAVVLKIDPAAKRLSLGLKQVLGNPWDTVKDRYPVGKLVEGKVTRLATFGAFVELEEGIDGLVHVSEFTNEKRIQNPAEVVKVGQVVRAVVLSADPETKRLKLGMKQLEATPTDQFVEESAVGDRVIGRIVEVSGNRVTVQLGEGVLGICVLETGPAEVAPTAPSTGSLAEQLAAAWKGGVKPATSTVSEPYRAGELRSFVIRAIDPAQKKIDLAPA